MAVLNAGSIPYSVTTTNTVLFTGQAYRRFLARGVRLFVPGSAVRRRWNGTEWVRVD